MRRSPDFPGSPLILDGRGRALPFDGQRLHESIRRALVAVEPGTEAENEAGDLAGVVGRYLEENAEDPALSCDAVAQLVLKLLEGTGHAEAARLYAGGRRRHDEGLAERVAGLLSEAGSREPATREPGAARAAAERRSALAELSPAALAALAREVEDGLEAAGLRDPSDGLLREWVDHALRHRGLPEGLGRHPDLGVPRHDLADLLLDGAPGLAAEVRGADALLRRQALEDVLPAEVAAAHDDGRLDLGVLAGRRRVGGLCVAPFAHAEVRAARSGCRVAVAGALVRELSALAAHEVAVLWDGPAPRGDERTQFELQLEQPAEVAGPVVLCLPGDDPAAVRPWLSWDALGEVCRLRIHGPVVHPELVQAAAERPASVELARGAPRPGLVLGGCALNLLRPAVAGPARDAAAYLDAVEELAALAAAGLAAWADHDPGAAAVDRVRERLGADAPGRWQLETAGLVQARVLLLGAGPRARQNGRDLAAAVGERLHRGWARRAAADEPLVLVPAGRRPQARFRRLDQPGRAPVAGGETRAEPRPEPLGEPLGEGETFAHEGEADPAVRGREVAALRAALGVADDAPAPRKAGEVTARTRFLHAFLDTPA